MKKIFIILAFSLILSGCNVAVYLDDISVPEDAYEVIRVYDGDTIQVIMNGQKENVRFIGIDAPETDGPYTKKECYGDEAKHYLTYLLSETHVHLLPDPTQDDRDSYGRLLRYAFTTQGENVGTLLLEQGYVKEFTFIKDYNFKNNYLAAQKRAQENGAGLWAPDLCSK